MNWSGLLLYPITQWMKEKKMTQNSSKSALEFKVRISDEIALKSGCHSMTDIIHQNARMHRVYNWKMYWILCMVDIKVFIHASDSSSECVLENCARIFLKFCCVSCARYWIEPLRICKRSCEWFCVQIPSKRYWLKYFTVLHPI